MNYGFNILTAYGTNLNFLLGIAIIPVKANGRVLHSELPAITLIKKAQISVQTEPALPESTSTTIKPFKRKYLLKERTQTPSPGNIHIHYHPTNSSPNYIKPIYKTKMLSRKILHAWCWFIMPETKHHFPRCSRICVYII
ncbi:uncharacterized protein LOC105664566 [Ceratitis capitata]|uniref:uncharacterized protein LOC105664566 n=1 Tax=Ceratitis capitata TaxID=7213 RepID=UPI000A0FA049|nr:uncharacterized protein LOC105664566 [Ceratitis capitata]